MKFCTKYLILTLLTLHVFNLNGQNINLKIKPEEKKGLVAKLNYRKNFSTKEAAFKEIENILLTLQFKGHLLASADTVFSDSSSVTAFISENTLFKTARLKMGNLSTRVSLPV